MCRGCPLYILLRRTGLLLGLVGLLLVLARCDWTTEPAEEESLVVETFLETSRPLPPIILRQTQSLSSADSLSAPASGADEVTLVLGDSTVPYTTTSAPGRYEPKKAVNVPPQTPWNLTVQWDGTTARAEGVTPHAIEVQQVCATVPDTAVRAVQVDSLRRDSLDIPSNQGYLYPINVTVQWTDPSPTMAETYWVRTQLRPDASPFPSEVVEFFLEPARIRPEAQFASQTDERQWRGVYAVPVDSSEAPLPEHELTTALVRGDTAFASFAQTRLDPDRREPLSNVEGALGVALAVSVDSLSRDITDSLTEQKKPRCWGPDREPSESKK